MKLSKTFLALTATLGLAGAAHSAVIVDATIVGNDVVFSGGGTLNTNDLTPAGAVPADARVTPSLAELTLGNAPGVLPVDLYSGISGWTTFGTINPPTLFTSGSGGGFGVSGLLQGLFVPAGYTSGDPLSATNTITGANFDTLGISRGQYVWTWGSGANADSFTLNVIPAPLPLALLATGALIGLGLRKKLKA
ncbi:MAG TPA: hypothetical protein VKP88_03640 [Candidatus Paceibacterota bacterium]|nr:hypothetical protein [Candidatus Paceibacterota bacterium]